MKLFEADDYVMYHAVLERNFLCYFIASLRIYSVVINEPRQVFLSWKESAWRCTVVVHLTLPSKPAISTASSVLRSTFSA